MEDKIIELQEIIAHQGVTLTQLSDELYAQQKETAELRRQVKLLSEQLQKYALDDDNGTPEPPPPHY